MNVACQPISLLNIYDGSSRTFGFPNHGWLAVVAFGSRFYFTPSVPRFNPRGVIPEIGGGYRRYPHLHSIHSCSVSRFLSGSVSRPFNY
ncbi:hypothetical protein [Limnospira fusiformis]|uniref:Uncharacterized protein n=1 Tax=Limnospira fusiformis PMC 851.14 TaxID=2219512 RepID=A0ABU9EGI8_LIMFS|nr:hypothetical protein HFV01_00570 [Limnospira fusiformis SAG 85.79]